MCPPGCSGILRGMDVDPGGTRDDQAQVIRIELRLSGSMPGGVATGPGGAARDFTGWMGLMSAVDALVSTDGDPTESQL